MAVEIRLTVKDDGTATVQKVAGELKKLEQQTVSSATGIGAAFGKMKANWLELSAGAAAAGLTLRKAWDLAETGANFEEAVGRLNHQLRQYQTTAAELIPTLKDLTGGQLSNAEAAKLASQALAAGLNPEQLQTFTQLAEVASDVLGTSIPQAMDTLITSMATGRTTMLKQIGIVVDLEAEVDKLAKATGREAQAITDVEKHQILLNAIIGQSKTAIAALSDGTNSAADSMQAFKAMIDDVEVALGGRLVKAGALAIEILAALHSTFGTLVGSDEIVQWADRIGGKAAEIWNAQDAMVKRTATSVKAAQSQQGDFWKFVAQLDQERAAAAAAATGGTVEQTAALKDQDRVAAQWGVRIADGTDLLSGFQGRVDAVTASLSLMTREQASFALARDLVAGDVASEQMQLVNATLGGAPGMARALNRPHTTPEGPSFDMPSIGGPLDNPVDFSLTGIPGANAGFQPLFTGGAGWSTPLVDAGLAGGIVPMADGGDVIVRHPTLFLAGEAGPERATFTPVGGGGAGRGGEIHLHFHGPVTSEQFVRDTILPAAREALLMKGRR